MFADFNSWKAFLPSLFRKSRGWVQEFETLVFIAVTRAGTRTGRGSRHHGLWVILCKSIGFMATTELFEHCLSVVAEFDCCRKQHHGCPRYGARVYNLHDIKIIHSHDGRVVKATDLNKPARDV